MKIVSVTQLVPVLQTAIGPVILISGVGLLLLVMTNRFGRIVDRTRVLAAGRTGAGDVSRGAIDAQLHILMERARLVRLAITLISVSALAAAVLIIVLFFSALWDLHDAWLIGSLFLICMACLSASLLVFIHDINRSLVALKLELKSDGNL